MSRITLRVKGESSDQSLARTWHEWLGRRGRSRHTSTRAMDSVDQSLFHNHFRDPQSDTTSPFPCLDDFVLIVLKKEMDVVVFASIT